MRHRAMNEGAIWLPHRIFIEFKPVLGSTLFLETVRHTLVLVYQVTKTMNSGAAASMGGVTLLKVSQRNPMVLAGRRHTVYGSWRTQWPAS